MAEVIGKYLIKAIEEVGPRNVLQIVTDNAKACQSAGHIIEKVHTNIFWSGYVCHTLNLVFKDFDKAFEWMHDTYKSGKQVVKFVINHGKVLAEFRNESSLELLRVAKTRFASHYTILKRLVDCRESLQSLIYLKSWKEWLKYQDLDTRTLGKDIVAIIQNESFWDEVENILVITKPIFCVLRFADGEGKKMSESYETMDSLVGEIRDVMSGNKYELCLPKMEEIVVNRWDKMNIPMHYLGFALNPRFYNRRYLQSPVPGDLSRRAPNLDSEVVPNVMNTFKRLAINDDQHKLLREQFVAFHQKKGMFALPEAHADSMTMSPIDWWATYGRDTRVD